MDAFLIEQARKGEAWAMDRLVREHRPAVARRVRRLCQNDADAEDVVQEVMLTLYRKLERFEGKASLATWLYRIATNAFLMHERRKRRDRLTFTERELYEREAGTFMWYAHEGTDGFTHVYERELQDAVSEAMETLPQPYRQILLLRRRDGLSLKEVSRLEKITVSSVKSRQYRAKQMLKAEMGLGELRG